MTTLSVGNHSIWLLFYILMSIRFFYIIYIFTVGPTNQKMFICNNYRLRQYGYCRIQ